MGHTAKPGVFVCCCCVTSYHKLSGVSINYLTDSLGQESRHRLGSSAQGLMGCSHCVSSCILSRDPGPLLSSHAVGKSQFLVVEGLR